MDSGSNWRDLASAATEELQQASSRLFSEWNPAGPSGQPPAAQMVISDSSNRPITMDDLGDKGEQEIGIARNEIYARHGRSFSKPEYANHFNNQPWYQPNPNYRDSELSPVEQRNLLFLHTIEMDYDMNGQRNAFKTDASVQPNLPGSLIADSSHRKLEDDEINALSPQQLRQAINEINARNGYMFKNADWQNYFQQFPWYQAKANFSERDLSWLEERNVEKLKIRELDLQLGAR